MASACARRRPFCSASLTVRTWALRTQVVNDGIAMASRIASSVMVTISSTSVKPLATRRVRGALQHVSPFFISHLLAQVFQPVAAAVVARTSAWLMVKVKPVTGPLPTACSVKVVASGVPEQLTTKWPKVRVAAPRRRVW